MNDVFKRAEARFYDGDEENSYILFMRYFHILGCIKKTYEYQKHKVSALIAKFIYLNVIAAKKSARFYMYLVNFPLIYVRFYKTWDLIFLDILLQKMYNDVLVASNALKAIQKAETLSCSLKER